MKPVRTIGNVNRGSDAPGLNAVIRAVVPSAINEHGMRVIGSGFDGLIWPEGAKELTEESVSGILPRGGTILGTTYRGNPFAYKSMENGKDVLRDYSSLCMENARRSSASPKPSTTISVPPKSPLVLTPPSLSPPRPSTVFIPPQKVIIASCSSK